MNIFNCDSCNFEIFVICFKLNIWFLNFENLYNINFLKLPFNKRTVYNALSESLSTQIKSDTVALKIVIE